MYVEFANGSHLSYCTNVHPGETLSDIYQMLTEYIIPIKREISPDKAFGVGLRLSYKASCELLEANRLEEFSHFFRQNGLYVFTINGFIYGPFHNVPVKENVYLPDWTHPERLKFTNNLAHILANMLPDEVREGSISTAPGAFKGCVNGPSDVVKIVQNLLAHVAELYHIKQKTGKDIVLCLEPEPGCFMETIAETVEFFSKKVYSAESILCLKNSLGDVNLTQCEKFLKDHLGICYDTCHMAIEYEDPKTALESLRRHGIKVAKVQISSAPKMEFNYEEKDKVEHLKVFVEDTYLHQAVIKEDENITRYNDLPLAMAEVAKLKNRQEWRVHFHIPIFLQEIPPFATTQKHILETLEYLSKVPLCQHYETETYTWNVLPQKYQCVDLKEAIAREIQWAKQQMERQRE